MNDFRESASCRRGRRSGWVGFALVVAGLAVHPAAAVAQSQVDSRWLPYVGCWETAGTKGEHLVCVTPNPENPASVILRAATAEQAAADTLFMDAVSRPVALSGCSGTERTFLSGDERRFFTTGEYTCSDGALQTGTGILAMVGPDEWVDIRTLSDGVDEIALVQRYIRASPAALEAAGEQELSSAESQLARVRASRAPEVSDIIEASEVVGARATNAWMLEGQYDLGVTASDLLAMADAGVDETVIDAAVALSNPDDFALILPESGMPVEIALADSDLSERERAARRADRVWYQPFGWRAGFSPFGPLWWPSGFAYDPFFYGGAWGGWGGWNAWGPWGGGFWGPWAGGGFVINGSGVGDPGQAVAGRGYINRNDGGSGTVTRGAVRRGDALAPLPSGQQRSGVVTTQGVERRGVVRAGADGRRGTITSTRTTRRRGITGSSSGSTQRRGVMRSPTGERRTRPSASSGGSSTRRGTVRSSGGSGSRGSVSRGSGSTRSRGAVRRSGGGRSSSSSGRASGSRRGGGGLF